jgi:hypothetical protein
MRQRLAIHRIGDERRLLDGFPHGEAFYEIRRLVEDRAVRAVEHFDRLLIEPNQVEHILEPGALPARAAHLHAGDMGLNRSPAISRALTDGDDFEGRSLFKSSSPICKSPLAPSPPKFSFHVPASICGMSAR